MILLLSYGTVIANQMYSHCNLVTKTVGLQDLLTVNGVILLLFKFYSIILCLTILHFFTALIWCSTAFGVKTYLGV